MSENKPEPMIQIVTEAPQTAAVLNIPVKEDIDIILEILQRGYEDVKTEYELNHPDETSEYAARKGSLCQELFAQLSKQGYSRYD